MKFKSRKTGEVLYVADSQAKTIRHMIMTGRYEVLHNDEWNESDHPRGENGQFGSGGGGSGAPKSGGVEVHGVQGMNSKPFRKTFKTQEAYEKWYDKNEGNVEVHGYRELESSGGKAKETEKRGIDKKTFRTNNEHQGYHGVVSRGADPRDANQAYSAMAGRVEALTGASENEIRDYLDSTRGRHLGGHEDDMNYIKKDFKDFMKSYDPEDYK